MKKQQLRAWELLFYNNRFTSLLQGTPGTGKTKTVAGQGLGLALCEVKTLITAPSNTAARESLIKLVQMLREVLARFPQAEEWFDIVYLPTRSTTLSDIMEADVDWEIMTDHTIKEGQNQTGQADVDKYALWRHIAASFEEDDGNRSDTEKQTKAKVWLDVLEAYKYSHRISAKDKKKFFLAVEGKAKEIFSSPLSNVKIVICTCNTAHLLQDYGYKPRASLADEAAFGSEPELIIPAILSASKNQYSGDHMQLPPVVKSAGHNEQSSQLGMSLFKRFYDHDSVEFIRFRMNYRMPKVLARFPGMVTYGFLGAHPSTVVTSDTLKYYQEWWSSDSAKPYRDARRKSEFGGPENDNPQRLFINVKNRKCAPKQGGKSKRNFANINAVCDVIMNLFSHQHSIDITNIDRDKITALTPYKEELHEISRHVTMRLKMHNPKIQRFPRFRTIDSTQGGENEIVLLTVTPADQHNGSVIGFIRKWNWMNVALTRAKSALNIFGNLDLWRSQLPIITKIRKAKKFGYMIMDLLDMGDVIDVDGDKYLPKTFAELRNGRQTWTMEIEATPPESSAFNRRAQVCLNTHSDPKVKAEYERKLLDQMRAMRKTAEEFERLDKAGVEYDLPSASLNVPI